MFVSLFTSGTYQDCEEACGDGLLVSRNWSAGAGTGEKSGACGISQNVLYVISFGKVRTMPSKDRHVPNNWLDNVTLCRLPKEIAVWFVQNEITMRGFMGIRPVLICDSLLFFMLGKPSLTMLAQNKPQSGLMLTFSCFRVGFFSTRYVQEIYRKKHRPVKQA